MRIGFINPFSRIPTSTGLVHLTQENLEKVLPLASLVRELYPSSDIVLGYTPELRYDLLISLWRGHDPRVDKATKLIQFNQEADDPLQILEADGFIGFDKRGVYRDMPLLDDKCYCGKNNEVMVRWPLYAMYNLMYQTRYGCSSFLEMRERFSRPNKNGRVAAVVSNGSGYCMERFVLLESLVNMGICDSGGPVLNNLPDSKPVTDKIAFISNYDMVFACENTRIPYYTTEKLYEALLVDSVPIYWGSPTIGEEFNPASYLVYDTTDESTIRTSMDRIVTVLNSRSALQSIQSTDPMTGFRSERYLCNGKQMFKDLIVEVLDTK